jgi:hypothetical protein
VNAHPKFDHALDLPSLRRLVTGIAAEPDAWRPLANVDAEHRHFAQLWRDDHVDVWVISWMNGHDTGFHDHDLSSGAVPAVTIHAYSPPLWRMGAYEVGERGELRRHSVSYAEELRPLSV